MDFILSRQNILQRKISIVLSIIYRTMFCLLLLARIADRVGILHRTLTPASVKYLLRKASVLRVLRLIAYCKLVLCGYLQRTSVFWPRHYIKYFRSEFPSYLQRMHRLQMTVIISSKYLSRDNKINWSRDTASGKSLKICRFPVFIYELTNS